MFDAYVFVEATMDVLGFVPMKLKELKCIISVYFKKSRTSVFIQNRKSINSHFIHKSLPVNR